jgi:hypothetical protein
MFDGNSPSKRCFILSGREIPMSFVPIIPGDPLASDIWIKLSPEGVVLYATSSIAHLLAPYIKPAHIIGTRLVDMIHALDRHLLLDALTKLSQSRSDIFMQIDCRFLGFAGGLEDGDEVGGGGRGGHEAVADVSMKPYSLQIHVEQKMPRIHLFCRIRLPHPTLKQQELQQIHREYPPSSNTLSVITTSGFDNCSGDGGDHVDVIDNIALLSPPPPNCDYAINLFDIMGETRATSLHYEVNQLKVQNKHLKDELAALLSS